MVRSLLESYFPAEEGYEIVASTPSAKQAAAFCKSNAADLVLMDVQTQNGENGLSAVKEIKATRPNMRIVVVTSLVDSSVLQQAQEVGADSLWYKDAEKSRLMHVVEKTLAGEHVFPDAPPLVEIGLAKSTEFTKTELKVLRYLLRGLSYSSIAQELGVEMSTVKFHVSNMLQKTGFSNKLQLALAASEAKLIVNLDED